jgi:DHA2 family multidrug resistance protein
LQHVNAQAFIQGVDDDFLVAAFVTILGFIPVILSRTKKREVAH